GRESSTWRRLRGASVARNPLRSMDLLRTVRLTVRDLLRQPGYTASTVLTLALAIGANSAIFSAVHGVLLTPSAIRQPDNLVISWERDVPRSPVVEVSYRN